MFILNTFFFFLNVSCTPLLEGVIAACEIKSAVAGMNTDNSSVVAAQASV